ncbi:MAG: N-6 DNA methylase [Candidatus Brocadiaceae bacterium]|nr:N-6 DNA methylase [Candidatus Brocadiaceae bacterium]
MGKMTAPQEILGLIERFDNNREAYRSGTYNETQLRREFIDPFFKILGWDVDNEKGYAEAYKDVIHEDSIKVGGMTKAPDYCFRIGGVRKFFVETKKPAVNLKDDINSAFQLRRYAWSAKLPLSILTDFEEFVVYDCRVKPDKLDKPSTARILYLNYTSYAQRWDEIASIFSRDAVLKGAFDKYAETSKSKRGTAEVDTAFLKEIESWRDILARNLALRNPDLTQHDLNFAIQRTIDRIIFLRICEDRGIEKYGRLMALQNGDRVYARLCEIFHRADERYNSGLFHFQKEKGRSESPDTLTLSLAIDDGVLKGIIKNLYYPDSPYEFSVLSADILGQVYEQFLGKVIRLTAGHRAVVEDKPEVKKAGGVYYTPTYIVDYIVKNTVGRLVNSGLPDVDLPTPKSPPERGLFIPLLRGARGVFKNPKRVSNLKILDPACGSGSFLLGAYNYLLDWHRDWYVADGPEKWSTGRSPTLYQGMGGDWRLTTAERKRILLNNIYGVDIDPQAVEVTKLSLLLKVLEGESEQTIVRQLKLFHERALPDLGNNIKCGNSLIGTDFYNPLNPPLLRGNLDIPLKKGGEGVVTSGIVSDEERYRINPFDWETEFPEIMKNGGFDVVIGNPPYGAEVPEAAIDYLKNKFQTFVWRGESYLVFVEQALQLIKRNGLFGYIIPDTYLNLGFTQSLRAFLLQNSKLREIVSLPSIVFPGTTVDTTLLFVEKAAKTTTYHESQVLVKLFNKKSSIRAFTQPNREFSISTKIWFEQNAFNVISNNAETKIITRIEGENKTLSHFAEMFSGIKTYEVGKGNPPQAEEIRNKKPFTSDKKEDKSWSPFYDGKHIGRYELLWKNNNWINYGCWLAAPREPKNFNGEKILIRKIVGKTLLATYVSETSYCNTLLFVLKLKSTITLSYHYLLGILNSQFIGWYFRKKFQISADDTFPQIMIRDILRFPIPCPDKARHNHMVELVNQMLKLHKQLSSAMTDHDKTIIQRQIDAIDRQIDQLVYELYGLADEEIKIVEEGLT